MAPLTTLLATLSLLGTALAAPTTGDLKPFRLKVHVPVVNNPDCHSDFEGLYIGPYHTGAGENDVTAYYYDASNSSSIQTASLNQTALQWNLTSFPWSMYMLDDSSYYKWLGIEINAGLAPENSTSGRGFFINETGLQWEELNFLNGGQPYSGAFQGWLVCDWWHTAPSLFFAYYFKPEPSRNCEVVQLLPEYVD